MTHEAAVTVFKTNGRLKEYFNVDVSSKDYDAVVKELETVIKDAKDIKAGEMILLTHIDKEKQIPRILIKGR